MTRTLKLNGHTIKMDDSDFYEYYFNGKFKWYISSDGYLVRVRGGRFARIIMKAKGTGLVVDHINGNRLDNRKSNLRLVTQQQNNFNRKPQLGGTSKYKGVYWQKAAKKWRAQIKVDKILIYLGLFVDENEAAKIYNLAAIKHFKDCAKLNSIS